MRVGGGAGVCGVVWCGSFVFLLVVLCVVVCVRVVRGGNVLDVLTLFVVVDVLSVAAISKKSRGS